MFIGHYRSVVSASEFYSSRKDELNFPTQVVYKNERYLLSKTIHIGSSKQYNRIIERAKNYSIDYDVDIS
jgi:hypothetical protein